MILEIPILAKGEFPHAGAGVVQVVDDAALDAVAGQEIPAGGILLDFDHYSDLTEEERAALAAMGIVLPSEAAGWLKRFARRGDKVFAEAELTPKGAESVEGKEYRFTSPTFDWAGLEDLGGGRVRPVHVEKVGLTNEPNMKAIGAILANRGRYPLANKDEDVEWRMIGGHPVPIEDGEPGAGGAGDGYVTLEEVWEAGKSGNEKKKAVQGTVDEAEAKRLKEATGYDIPAGTKHVVTADCIRHIKGHNEATLAAIRDLDAFRATADKIEASSGFNGEKRVRHWKKIGDRDWVCVEEWWRKKGELSLVSLKKNPKGTPHADNRRPEAVRPKRYPDADPSIWERFVKEGVDMDGEANSVDDATEAANNKHGDNMEIEKLAELLGCEATEEAVTAALEALKAKAAKADEAGDPNKGGEGGSVDNNDGGGECDPEKEELKNRIAKLEKEAKDAKIDAELAKHPAVKNRKDAAAVLAADWDAGVKMLAELDEARAANGGSAKGANPENGIANRKGGETAEATGVERIVAALKKH